MAGRHVELFGGERTSTMFPVIDQREKLSGLLEDPRIHGLLSALLGDDFNYAGGDGHHYIGDTVSLPPPRCLACRVVSAAHSSWLAELASRRGGRHLGERLFHDRGRCGP